MFEKLLPHAVSSHPLLFNVIVLAGCSLLCVVLFFPLTLLGEAAVFFSIHRWGKHLEMAGMVPVIMVPLFAGIISIATCLILAWINIKR